MITKQSNEKFARSEPRIKNTGQFQTGLEIKDFRFFCAQKFEEVVQLRVVCISLELAKDQVPTFIY